jgi:hypothetical protein
MEELMNGPGPTLAALLLACLGACGSAIAGDPVLPAHLGAADLGGAAFERDDVVRTTVTVVAAGEAVTVPKEWTGVWETDGYTRIGVIYSADGSGLR